MYAKDKIEPQHEKNVPSDKRPAKTQISLHITLLHKNLLTQFFRNWNGVERVSADSWAYLHIRVWIYFVSLTI